MIEAPGVHKTCCFYVDIPGFLAVSLKHFIPRKAGIHGWNPAHACARAHSKTLKKTRVGKQHIYSWLTWVSFEFTALGAPTKNTSFCWESILTHPLERFFFAQSPPNNMGPYIQNKPHNFSKVWSFVKFSMFDLFCFWNPSIGDYNIFLGVTWFYFPKLAMLSALLRHPCVVFDLAMDGSGDVTLVSMWKWLEKRGGCTMFCVCVCVRVCGVQCRASFSISGKQVGMAVTCHGPPWQSGVLQKWDQRILHNDVSQKRLFGHCILSMHVSIICWCNIILWIWFWCT